MTSQEFDTSGGSGGKMATASDSGGIVMAGSSNSDVAYEVKSLKALSLNGLDKGLNPAAASSNQDGVAMTSSNTVNTQDGIKIASSTQDCVGSTMPVAADDDPTSMLSAEALHDLGARPKPRLSWGNVTEIPDGGVGDADTDSNGSHIFEKYKVNEDAWKIRSTQNPSRPLVRRPTPMAISVPKSVLGKGSSKIMAGSFEEGEEEEEQEEGSSSPVPVSLRKRWTYTDVLVVEDIVEEEEEEEEDEEGCVEALQAPTNLPVQSAANAAALQTDLQSNAKLNAISPTIVVQTTFGKHMSVDEAEELENNNQEKEAEDAGEDDGEDAIQEEARGEVDDTPAANTEEAFLSPDTKPEVYEKRTNIASNTHAQTSPSQKPKLVRRITPIALDLPNDVKGKGSLKKSTEILEEEEEEEEPSATSVSSTSVLSTPSIVEFREEDEEEEEAEEGSAVDSANCNNNHHYATETSSLDVVDGMDSDLKKGLSQSTSRSSSGEQRQGLFRKSASIDGRHTKQYLTATGIASSTGAKGHFRKSASCDKSDGRRSPLSAMRKVSPHHTKILTRQQTPIDLIVPKSVLSDALKAKGAQMAVEEGAEDEN